MINRLSGVLLSHPRGALQGEFPQFPQALRQSACWGEPLGLRSKTPTETRPSFDRASESLLQPGAGSGQHFDRAGTSTAISRLTGCRL
jgi:hypothetical protein